MKTLRTAAVIARRPSESMLILHTALLAALRSCSSGMPTASLSLPPCVLMIFTYSCGTDEAPCSTIGNPGSFFSISARMSKRSSGGTRMPSALRVHCSGLNLLAPCDVVRDLRSYLVFDAGQYAQLAFDRHVVLVSILDDLFREGYVLIVGERRTVDHHRREAHVDAALAQFERIAVVEVQRNRNTLAAVELLGILHGALCHVAQQRLVGVFAGAGRHLQDNGRIGLDARRNDRLQLLHVVEVECRNGITALDGLGEHLARIHQSEFFVRYHNR